MRRTAGPKRRAESYAARAAMQVVNGRASVTWIEGTVLCRMLAAAYMAGYSSAARARRKPGEPDEPTRDKPTPATRSG